MRLKFRILPVFFALFCLVSSAFAQENAMEENSIISLLTSTILMKQHYLKKAPDAASSKELFNSYLDALDPQHIFFTQEEIEGWRVMENSLVQKLLQGDSTFAYIVFRSYTDDLKRYQLYVKEHPLTAADFETDDTFESDRSKAPWPKDRAEQEKLWYGKIRNDMILLRMYDRIQAEQQKEDAEKKKAPVQDGKLWKVKTPEERLHSRVDQFVKLNLEMKPIEVLEIYLNAFAHLYDPHTDYFAPKTNENFNITMRLSLVGIGAILQMADDGSTKVVSIVPGGPAEKQGELHPGDHIIAVAQGDEEPVDTIDMNLDKVVSMIRGKEGTDVVLTVWDAKSGSSAPPKIIRITREEVKLKDSEAKAEVREVPDMNGTMRRVAILSLPSFYIDFEAAGRGDEDYKSSTRDVLALLEKLEKGPGFDVLLVDLRANGGGSLQEAISLTGLFIDEGPVVQTRNSEGDVSVESDRDDGRIAYNGPMIVLTNRLSASASEIFAGAIRDYQRGILVGDARTHGKGTVQTILDLGPMIHYIGSDFDGGALKLTNAKFYRINGSSTQLKGVEPDIVFPSFTDVMEIGEENSKNAMPWDTIPPVKKIKVYDRNLNAEIRTLKTLSDKRLQDNPEFKVLKKDIEWYRLNKEKKVLSLNFQKRWAEYLEEKKMLDQQTKLLHLDAVISDEEKQKNKERDLFLDETARIAADYAALREEK